MDELKFGDNLIRKLRTLNGFPLRVSIFERYPTALLKRDLPALFLHSYFSKGMRYAGGFNGFDGLILGNMAQQLNFRANIIKPIGNDYGYKLDNGTFIGSIFNASGI